MLKVNIQQPYENPRIFNLLKTSSNILKILNQLNQYEVLIDFNELL